MSGVLKVLLDQDLEKLDNRACLIGDGAVVLILTFDEESASLMEDTDRDGGTSKSPANLFDHR